MVSWEMLKELSERGFVSHGVGQSLLTVVKVNYRVGKYKGELHFPVNKFDDDATIIIKAKTELEKRNGFPLPVGFETYEIQKCYF